MKHSVVPRSGSSMTSAMTNAKPGHERHEQVPGPAQRAELLLAGEQVGAPQQHADLRELRRLQLQRAEVDPAPRAVDLDADAGHQHGQQRDEAEHRAPGRRAAR